jgi:hypothetical protein
MFHKYKVSVSAQSRGGFTPNNAARIADTSNPPVDDLDLGSPNEKCIGGGPGVGVGGGPEKPYPNCKPLGNVLIIQESNKTEVDDNYLGGNITFSFATSAVVQSLGILDIDDDKRGAPKIYVS